MAGINDIEWSPILFKCLTIPDEKKAVIMALAETRMCRETSVRFDDFVRGKGRGLTLLLKCDFNVLPHLQMLTRGLVVHQELERL